MKKLILALTLLFIQSVSSAQTCADLFSLKNIALENTFASIKASEIFPADIHIDGVYIVNIKLPNIPFLVPMKAFFNDPVIEKSFLDIRAPKTDKTLHTTVYGRIILTDSLFAHSAKEPALLFLGMRNKNTDIQQAEDTGNIIQLFGNQ